MEFKSEMTRYHSSDLTFQLCSPKTDIPTSLFLVILLVTITTIYLHVSLFL